MLIIKSGERETIKEIELPNQKNVRTLGEKENYNYRRPDLVLIRKKKITYRLIDFAVSADHKMKNKIKRKDRQILGPCQRTKKAVEPKSLGNTNRSWCTWNSP